MRCNISENQVIFCGRVNYKQYYEAKTSSIFRLVELKRLYGTIIDGRGPQWFEDYSARPTNKWSCKGRQGHAIPALYYPIVASTCLFTTVIMMLWL